MDPDPDLVCYVVGAGGGLVVAFASPESRPWPLPVLRIRSSRELSPGPRISDLLFLAISGLESGLAALLRRLCVLDAPLDVLLDPDGEGNNCALSTSFLLRPDVIRHVLENSNDRRRRTSAHY